MTCASRRPLRRATAAGARDRARRHPRRASVRSAARSFAERARGLAATSLSSATIGRLVRMRNVVAACTACGAWREAALRRPRDTEESLDDTVLERVERHDHKPATGTEHLFGGPQRRDELVELLVHENAQRLKCARRRMDGPGPDAHQPLDDVGERTSGADRRLAARPDDRTRHRARVTLLPQRRDDLRRGRAQRRPPPRRPRSARCRPYACRADRRGGTKSPARPDRAASRTRRDRAPRRRWRRGRGRARPRPRFENRSSTSISRPPDCATRSNPCAIVLWSRSIPITLQSAAARIARE